MRRYPSYKDSGIDWLREIPEHWEVKKLKYLVKEKLKYGANESAELDEPSLPRYIRITDFGDDGKLRDDTFKSLPQDKAKEYLLEEGDILFARSGATVGKTFQFKGYDGIACFAGYLIKASPDNNKILSDFVYYYTKSNAYNNWKNGIFIQATIQNIGADKYQTLLVTRPSLNEQKQIIDFLDCRTSQINELIAKKERVIELLKEKRTALISHAVTKGLNPDAKMKDSGVDWLGDVPEHWESSPLKHVCVLVGRIGFRGYSTEDIVAENEGAITLSPSNMKDGGIDMEKCTYISWDKYYESPEIMVFSDEILMVKTGSTYGKVSYVNHISCPATINPQIMILKKIETAPKYLFYVSTSAQFQSLLKMLNTGSTIPTMTQAAVGRLDIPMPPIDEQWQIVAFLDRETSKIDTLIAKVIEAIEKLKEYHTALISAAVTGKIDVREEYN